jgi:5'-3' exonuclease
VRGGPLLLVDLGSLLHRSLHSERGTARATAWRVVDHVLSAAVRHDAERVVVCDEEPREQLRRRRLDAGYKGRRADRTEREAEHFALARLAVDALGLPRVRVPEEEADDVCASYARAHRGETVILTQDRDLLGCASERVGVDFLGGSGVLHADACAVLLGVVPHRLACYKALVGDPSDNYRGVPGVGPRTAVELLRRWGSFPELVERRAEIDGRPGRLLRDGWQEGVRCHELARLRDDLDVPAVPSWAVDEDRARRDLSPHDLAFLIPNAVRIAARRMGPPPEPVLATPPRSRTAPRRRSVPASRPPARVRATRTRVRPQDDPRVLTLF